jgi:hypothetical protein
MKVRERNADIQKLVSIAFQSIYSAVVCSRDGGDYVDKRLITLEIRTSPLSLHTRKQTLHQLGRSPAPALSPPEYPGGSLIESEICRQSSQPTLVGQSCSTDR